MGRVTTRSSLLFRALVGTSCSLESRAVNNLKHCDSVVAVLERRSPIFPRKKKVY